MSSEKFENFEDEFQQSYEAARRLLEDKVQKAKGEEKKKLLRDVDRQLDELSGILDEMEMESRTAPYPYRSDMNKRTRDFREKLDRINQRCRVVKEQRVQGGNSGGDWTTHSDPASGIDPQRMLLLQGNASADRASQSLSRAHQVAIETDEVGQGILTELGEQRESLVRVSDRLTDTDNNLKQSRKILKSMYRRVITNKLILILIIVLEVFILIGVVYWRFFKK